MTKLSVTPTVALAFREAAQAAASTDGKHRCGAVLADNQGNVLAVAGQRAWADDEPRFLRVTREAIRSLLIDTLGDLPNGTTLYLYGEARIDGVSYPWDWEAIGLPLLACRRELEAMGVRQIAYCTAFGPGGTNDPIECEVVPFHPTAE